MHSDAGNINLAQFSQHTANLLTRGTADSPRDDQELTANELAFDDFPDAAGLTGGNTHSVYLSPSIAAGCSQRVGVDVVDLTEPRCAVNIDQLITNGNHGHTWLGVHQNLRTPHRCQQSNL